MGFLKDMLNPAKHLKDTKRAVGNLASGNIKGAIDPAGLFVKDDPRVTAASGMEDPSAAVAAGGNYFGDSADSAYGSFTQPFDVEQFYKYQDPGYAFRLQQGQQGVLNAASAGDGARAGAATKDLIGFNQNLASTEFGSAFDRYQVSQGNIFSRLFDLARLGQNAAAGVGTSGTQLAGTAGGYLSNAGAASGAGIVGAGNALADGATNAWLWKGINGGGAKPQATNQAFYGNDF